MLYVPPTSAAAQAARSVWNHPETVIEPFLGEKESWFANPNNQALVSQFAKSQGFKRLPKRTVHGTFSTALIAPTSIIKISHNDMAYARWVTDVTLDKYPYMALHSPALYAAAQLREQGVQLYHSQRMTKHYEMQRKYQNIAEDLAGSFEWGFPDTFYKFVHPSFKSALAELGNFMDDTGFTVDDTSPDNIGYLPDTTAPNPAFPFRLMLIDPVQGI
ncbi:MAG: hypothetical protein WAZ18_05655 [Alphaproteobacteria bacterium]